MHSARPGWPRPLRARMADNAGAWAKLGCPEKRLRFSRAAEFGRARRAEPEEGPQGPDAADNHLLGVGGSAQKFEIH